MKLRWGLIAALVVIVAFAGGLAFALHSSPRPGVPRPLTASTQAGELSVSVPRGFRNYPLNGDVTKPGVIGHVLTNFRVPPTHPSGWPSTIDWVLNRWSAASQKFIAVRKHNYGPPSNEVALELTKLTLPPCRFTCPPVLQLPLTPNQPWFQKHLASGAPSFRLGYLRLHHHWYYVMYWIGQNAPTNDRTAVVQALRSIRPA